MEKRLFFSLLFLGKVALATILPLLVFAVSGRLIDNKFNTSPIFLSVALVLSLIASILWLRILSIKMTKQINKIN